MANLGESATRVAAIAESLRALDSATAGALDGICAQLRESQAVLRACDIQLAILEVHLIREGGSGATETKRLRNRIDVLIASPFAQPIRQDDED